MQLKSLPAYMAVLLVDLSAVTACKTSASDTKSNKELQAIAEMSEADFITACSERVNDPAQGPMALAMLQQYVETTDCKEAYPRLKVLAAEDAKIPDKPGP